ncbi:trans-2-enoyl-CoA reductase family protein [Vibrio sp. SCSIO 43135]|uniref:enoyl-ACP reductase FabV n=1 Tax=Vibrio sp. SCSIO 43135 TaxID=2819096 RepID=UPI00207623D3|nr:enoyl-ACP reductase FabV [Vibrio sp. SCSIO 43135]USD43960.1 trans-2-enoyl-CoA reductase family protein [Vibrio sp. SCSIO 43135]
MIIEPVINGVVARTAHPYGCEQAVLEQIRYIQQTTTSDKNTNHGPARVLILGGSSGFGLAARIALAFGASESDTISVSFERGPSEKGVGTAGWYNNYYFKKHAEQEGRIAVNIDGDAFGQETRTQVIEAIETYFEGEVDLVIYSLATGARPNPETGELWRSSIKPIGEAVTGASVMLETDTWQDLTLQPASEQEIESTMKVMGGEDWESWIDALINAESIADGCQTIAFSYIGPEVTHPIYLDGTLGRAKVDLHQTSHALNLKLANFGGAAYATVCKALVTKASVFIPGLTPYMMALYEVMKEQGTHEGCIEQMHRLFTQKLYINEPVHVDGERLIRIDDLELDSETQQKVQQLLTKLNRDNFKELADYRGFKTEFMKLNGFDFDGIDYKTPINIDEFINITP